MQQLASSLSSFELTLSTKLLVFLHSIDKLCFDIVFLLRASWRLESTESVWISLELDLLACAQLRNEHAFVSSIAHDGVTI